MKKHPPPWSVRGVSQEARAKAARAAARRRMTIGAWVTGALTSAANAELGVGHGTQAARADPPAGDAATLADQLADYERHHQLKFDELAAAIAALAEQLDKAAGPTARLVSVDHLARAIKPLEHALDLAAKIGDDDSGAGGAPGRISNLPGARGG